MTAASSDASRVLACIARAPWLSYEELLAEHELQHDVWLRREVARALRGETNQILLPFQTGMVSRSVAGDCATPLEPALRLAALLEAVTHHTAASRRQLIQLRVSIAAVHSPHVKLLRKYAKEINAERRKSRSRSSPRHLVKAREAFLSDYQLADAGSVAWWVQHDKRPSHLSASYADDHHPARVLEKWIGYLKLPGGRIGAVNAEAYRRELNEYLPQLELKASVLINRIVARGHPLSEAAQVSQQHHAHTGQTCRREFPIEEAIRNPHLQPRLRKLACRFMVAPPLAGSSLLRHYDDLASLLADAESGLLRGELAEQARLASGFTSHFSSVADLAYIVRSSFADPAACRLHIHEGVHAHQNLLVTIPAWGEELSAVWNVWRNLSDTDLRVVQLVQLEGTYQTELCIEARRVGQVGGHMLMISIRARLDQYGTPTVSHAPSGVALHQLLKDSRVTGQLLPEDIVRISERGTEIGIGKREDWLTAMALPAAELFTVPRSYATLEAFLGNVDVCDHPNAIWQVTGRGICIGLSCSDCGRHRLGQAYLHQLSTAQRNKLHLCIPDRTRYIREVRADAAYHGLPDPGMTLAALRARDESVSLDPAAYALHPPQVQTVTEPPRRRRRVHA